MAFPRKPRERRQRTKPDATYPPAAATGAPDDDAAYWAEQARGALPEPFGEWAAQAIESCGERTKKSAKLIPGAPGRRLLEKIGQSAEWSAAPPADRAAVIGLLADGAAVVERVIRAALGTAERPPAVLASDTAGPATFADVPSVPVAPAVAYGVLYRGKLGLMHGPAGGGKTTVLANAAARVTTGAPWLGQPTIRGTVLIVCEDRDTWKSALEAAGADQSAVRPVRWPDLAPAVERFRPVAVVVDTLQYVAAVVGSGELDSARETDRILRPLERLARDHGAAVMVADHEPWADGAGPTDAASGTKKRPRHSGAKVATCDYLIRCSTDGDVTTIERGAKVRRGIVIDAVTRIDIHGNPTAAPPAAGADMDGDTIVTDRETYDRVLGYLARTPDTWQSVNRIAKGAGARKADVSTALEQLASAGRAEKRPARNRSTEYRIAKRGESCQ